MNKIPTEFEVKGKTWKVEYKWRLEEPGIGQCNGLCDFSKRTIYIDRLLPKEDKPKVFLHELGHAILHEAHLHEQGGIDGIVEEVAVDAYADTLISLFDLKWRRR